MKLTTISNIKIKEICKKLNVPLIDVLMKDQFHKGLPIGLYVLNLNNSDQGGSHWTSLIKLKGGKYLYCDSFGAPPPQTVLNSLDISPGKLMFNDQQIQHLNATNCGYYCILFLYYYTIYKTPSKTITNYLKHFTTDEAENDKVLRDIFKELL